MTCTHSGDGTVTPRSPSERMACASIVAAFTTPIRSRLAARSTLRTFVRPPSAARRLWIVVSPGAACGDEAALGSLLVPCGTAPALAATFDSTPGAAPASGPVEPDASAGAWAGTERSTSRISPAICSAFAPMTTCSDVADGRTKPLAPRAFSASLLMTSCLATTRRRRVIHASSDTIFAAPPKAAM